MSPAIDPARLAVALAEATDATASVLRVERLTGGSSREIHAVDAEIGGTERALILRCDPPGEQRPGALALEAAVMSSARAAGVAVPEVLAVLDEPGLPAALVMDRVDGEAVPRRVLREEGLARARAALGPQLGAALGRLHGAARPEGLPAEDRLQTYGDTLQRLGTRPVLELVHRWLVANRPASHGDVLVHGDFRLGNVVVGPDGLVAVLDWESAHVGDALEDLGWLCVPAWRFRGEGEVAGVGDVASFLDAYRAAGGPPVTEAELRWGIVLGTWIWAVGCIEQADRHRSGAQRSVDLAAVGRRVTENEADLLDLLVSASGAIPPASLAGTPAAPPPDPVAPHGTPPLAELLEAVREAITDEVLPSAEGRSRYLLQVCASVLGIAERELAAPPVDPSGDAALLERCRTEPLDGDLGPLLGALLVRLDASLAVDAPARAAQLRASYFQ